MDIIKKLNDFEKWKSSQNTSSVGFVPTMGALHDGHIALVTQAKKNNSMVVASIFVNPAQFAPNEDLDTYPRTFDSDCQKLKAAGCNVVWAPTPDIMYPNGDMTSNYKPSNIALPLEGQYRPYFFKGVTTVVGKLFEQVEPTHAYFGEKDFQQLQVIRQMVTDYNFQTDIIAVPTIRDKNGLALSSRNAYLSADDYAVAIQLNKIMKDMANRFNAAESLTHLEEDIANRVLKAGFTKIDYCTIRNENTLLPSGQGPHRVLAAVWLGQIRLIDNCSV